MIGCRLFAGLLALALWIVQIQAKSVFAHFMLSNTAGFTVADYQREIGLAQEAHIDGFAVNFSMDEDTTDANLPLFFTAAESEGFKLFLSFDYAGNGAWPQGTVITMIKKYAASSAYFRRGSQPLVSTFEGPKSSSDWPTIKKETGPSPCTCSIKGRMVQPPASKPVGYPLANLGSEYIGLCAFACSRGYCPPSACTQTRPAVPGGIFKETPLDDDGKVKDMAACKAANSGLL
ncbi:Mutanase like protein [Verticillium longisporum]|uniref:Mutanase like protein n=1 Tax=Verticillium longisporum TaxID=100787 RepID=A0A8I3AJA5_VERLO|nr:Mutanase like protein [Verticillium longisporum]